MKPKRRNNPNRKNMSDVRHACIAKCRTKNYSDSVSEVKNIIVIKGFGSSRRYVKAVSRIYSREINDIDRFVHFAESLVKEK